MPLPKVKNKSRKEFYEACMADNVMRREYLDEDQRYMVCKSIYDRRNKTKAEGEEVKWEEPDERGFLLI